MISNALNFPYESPYEYLYESPYESSYECFWKFECLNVFWMPSRDVVVKMDTTSGDSEYDSDIDWIDDSDFEFIDDAVETILKGIKLFFWS